MSHPSCGELKGYNRHLRRREPACQPCKDASNAHARQRWANATEEQLNENRLRQRARQAAYRRLADTHRQEYQALYLRELARNTGQEEAS